MPSGTFTVLPVEVIIGVGWAVMGVTNKSFHAASHVRNAAAQAESVYTVNHRE
jgi:hypothetical protein